MTPFKIYFYVDGDGCFLGNSANLMYPNYNDTSHVVRPVGGYVPREHGNYYQDIYYWFGDGTLEFCMSREEQIERAKKHPMDEDYPFDWNSARWVCFEANADAESFLRFFYDDKGFDA